MAKEVSNNSRVLIVSNMYPNDEFPSYGIFVKRFCEQLDEINIKYKLCVMHNSNSKFKKLLHYVVFYLRSFWQCVMGEEKLVYVHYASHSTPAVLVARHFRKFRLTVNVHGSDVVPESRSQNRMQKYTKESLNQADFVVVPSEYFKQYVSEKYCLDAEKIKIYPSAGVDLKVFHPCKSLDEKDVIKRKFELDEKKILVGCIGRMTESKGWSTFIASLENVLKRHDNIQVVMVGSGNYEDQITDRLRIAGVEDQVKKFPLLDQENLAQIYRVLDLLVFPTEREGESLGLVAIEAMASGTVVLASDYAAPKYYISDGDNGLKFEMGNSASLEKKIENFFEMDEQTIEMIKKSALETAYTFSSEVVTRDLKIVLEQNVRE